MNTFEQYMQSNRLTLAAIADQLGVGVATVHQWKTGVARPGWERAAQIEAWSGGEVPLASWVRPDGVPIYND